MGLIKDIYNITFFNELGPRLQEVLPSLDKDAFIRQIYADGFREKEWKQRMQHITAVLHRFMPAGFLAATNVLVDFIEHLRNVGEGEDKLVYIFLPDYIATYGLDDLEISSRALEFVTQFVSAEFAVRPFLLKYGQQMVDEMQRWSLHPHYKVRRLASEGSRPKLPWAMAVPLLKQLPLPTLSILENLKADPAPWVRKSVANHLNDLAKDYPDTVLEIAHRWKGISKETDAIVKHGCRTLLKQGHPAVLALYGLDGREVQLTDFELLTPEVEMGGDLQFSFTVSNHAVQAQVVRLEYAIYYRRLNDTLTKKVFKISERIYEGDESCLIKRRQSFRPITTRQFYTGEHLLAIIINGEEKKSVAFSLVSF